MVCPVQYQRYIIAAVSLSLALQKRSSTLDADVFWSAEEGAYLRAWSQLRFAGRDLNRNLLDEERSTSENGRTMGLVSFSTVRSRRRTR